MRHYKAKSMKEALELANRFKEEGKFDLFRGQARDWEVVSSASRINDNSLVMEEMQKFYQFCATNELLKPYIDSEKFDEFIAIAQHYGLKTNFVDFTSSPEIAMYFATHDKSCEVGQESVIVCLNRNEFEEEVRNGYTQHLISKQNLPIPSIIEVDLTNLWRLEAQKGCFMEQPFIGFDKLYGFDKIYFPYSEPFDSIQKFDIYPERKSPIELELDKFFMDMRMSGIAKIEKKFTNTIHIGRPPMEAYNKIFQDYSKLQKHSSWNNIDNKWNNETQVQWEYQNERKQIRLDIQKLANNDSVYYNQFVTTISQHRDMLINIDLINAENYNSNISEKIKSIYDGMNFLPYSNEHIANAIKELLHIELHFENMANKIEMEFGERDSGKGYYSRAYIFENDYQSLLREDILEYINLKYLSENANAEDIKKNISKSIINLGCNVSLIFDFHKFADLFAKMVIPFQVYLNRNIVLFNPAKIKIFGEA